MSVTEERKNAVDFTDHYYTNKLQFVAPKNVDFKTDESYLKGKVIGAQRATIAGTWLEDNLDRVVDIKLYDTQENAYLDLASGRVDGILATPSCSGMAQERCRQELRVQGRAGIR